MTMQIVGILLVRNEDRFVSRAVLNALDFCDEIIALDNQSSDETYGKLQDLARSHIKVSLHRVSDPALSHRFIEAYAGTQTWLFGLDGDEIYDPKGLQRMRRRLRSGEFDGYWRVYGHSLHVTDLDPRGALARGYITPSARSITKLHNFAAIKSWKERNTQRLHGRNMRFRAGYSAKSRLRLQDLEAWESCDFRCLHMCFVPRSLQQSDMTERINPSEMARSALLRRQLRRIRYRLTGRPMISYKRRVYAVGDIVEKDAETFFGFPASPPLLAAERSV